MHDDMKQLYSDVFNNPSCSSVSCCSATLTHSKKWWHVTPTINKAKHQDIYSNYHFHVSKLGYTDRAKGQIDLVMIFIKLFLIRSISCREPEK